LWFVDIDECETMNAAQCDQLRTCQNTPGSYRCSCRSGFEGDSDGNCTGKVHLNLATKVL